MRLLVLRHGVAGDRDEFAFTGRPDGERPLTRDGREKMKRAAAGLAIVAPDLDLIATSPMARAAQTADIVAGEYRGSTPVPLNELAAERAPDDLLPWLRTHGPQATVAVVGHNPYLSFLVGWLLTGRHECFVEIKKGGAVMLEFEDPPAPGGALLLWSLAPAHLRKLRKPG